MPNKIAINMKVFGTLAAVNCPHFTSAGTVAWELIDSSPEQKSCYKLKKMAEDLGIHSLKAIYF